MKKNLTEIVFILDRSGSMSGLEADTVGGFNTMLRKQKQKPGQALVSTLLFSSDTAVIHDRVSLDQVPELTPEDYCPMGSTALLDALGGAVHHIGNVHKYAREEDRPEHTIFVITTDGMENSSHLYTYNQVRQMILRQQERYGWEFLFLGANMDAVSEAARFGIPTDRAVRYQCDAAGTGRNYEAVEQTLASVRSCGTVPENWSAPIEADFKKRSKT